MQKSRSDAAIHTKDLKIREARPGTLTSDIQIEHAPDSTRHLKIFIYTIPPIFVFIPVRGLGAGKSRINSQFIGFISSEQIAESFKWKHMPCMFAHPDFSISGKNQHRFSNGKSVIPRPLLSIFDFLFKLEQVFFILLVGKLCLITFATRVKLFIL